MYGNVMEWNTELRLGHKSICKSSEVPRRIFSHLSSLVRSACKGPVVLQNFLQGQSERAVRRSVLLLLWGSEHFFGNIIFICRLHKLHTVDLLM